MDGILDLERTGTGEGGQVVGQARTRTRVNVRLGDASVRAPIDRVLSSGTDVFITDIVEGDTVSGNARWYACRGLGFVWSGACEDYRVLEPVADLAQEPDRPERAVDGGLPEPEFETLEGVFHKVRGPRPNGLEGLVVHFDAGRSQPFSDRGAKATMRYGARKGYHYGAISRSGRIFLPQGFSWEGWGYHAGTSTCPRTGRDGVSQFYVGFELNNPGRLYQAKEDGVFCPWFNAKRDRHGRVILDEDGRCKRLSEQDEWYREYEIRFCEGENIQAGCYLPYTREQMDALTHICLWLAQTYPDSFRLDHVLGHDEVAPGRKSDPGGALGGPDAFMTMAAYRQYLTDSFER